MPKIAKDMTTLYVYLKLKDKKRLEEISSETNLALTDIARIAFKEYIDTYDNKRNKQKLL